MKQNELTIEIPNNKVVDWEESKKQNKIVLKDRELTYKEICQKLFLPNGCFYICENGEIAYSYGTDRFSSYANNATSNSNHQLECILAKNKLANVAKYLNDGWKPTISTNDFGYFIFRNENYNNFWIKVCDDYMYNSNVLFKTKELAYQAIKILGKETVKLALEPLGF